MRTQLHGEQGKTWIAAVLGIVVLLIIIGAVAGGSNNTSTGTTKSPALVTTPTTTTATATKPAPAPTAKAQTFTGAGTENLGTINVPVQSTLHWRCPSCGSDNFVINNSFNDDNQLTVNDLNETSGQTAVDSGTYTDVQVLTEGQAWTVTITPGS